MKALIQRVKSSSVAINGETIGKINNGLLVFLGICKNDEYKDADFLVNKITELRIFASESKPMDLSLKDINGQILIISQFTLCGSTKNGRRPDFGDSASPEEANKFYEYFIDKCKEKIKEVKTGKFGAMMEVKLINDGPVTFMIES